MVARKARVVTEPAFNAIKHHELQATSRRTGLADFQVPYFIQRSHDANLSAQRFEACAVRDDEL